MVNVMKNLASWFAGKGGEEEKQKVALMTDSSKSMKKRFGALTQLLRHYRTGRDRSTEFIRTYHQILIEICVGYLKSDITKNKVKIAWEEVSAILKCLIELTRVKPIPMIDTIQDIASNCLNDANRWELRELGMSIVLNLLDFDMSLQVPNFLFQAAVDFTKIKPQDSRVTSLFPDRSSLLFGAGSSNQADTLWMYLVRSSERATEPVQSKNLQELETLVGTTLNREYRECIFFLNKILDYATGDGSDKIDHFNRWFGILKGTILFLLYPGLCRPAEQMGQDFGYRGTLPAILQYMIVKWLAECIRVSEFVPVLMGNDQDFQLITKIIGKSFFLVESYSAYCFESASIAIKIYEEWMFCRCITNDFSRNWARVICNLLKYPVVLFDFTLDISSGRISLCKEFLKMLEKAQTNSLDLEVILNISLQISQKTLETHPRNKSLQDIVEPIAEFLIKLLANSMIIVQIPWEDFINILKNWSITSDVIIDCWLEVIKPITQDLKDRMFPQSKSLEGWLWMLKVLGDPLQFSEKTQLRWVNALQELIILIVTPPHTPLHTSPNPNFILEIFFLTLSKLIRQGGKDSQAISLNILVAIFVNTKCDEMPMQCYLQHISLLLYTSMQKKHLQATALDAIPKLLDFSGMHFLIHSFLKLAGSNLHNALKFIFYIMCLPNYYGDTKLENTDEIQLTYAGLKPTINSILVNCIEDPSNSISALYGTTVFILEELEAGNESISNLVAEVIQPKCLCENEDIAITALHCLQILSGSLPNLSKSIFDFLIARCLSEVKNSHERAVKAVLNTIQNWLLVNNSTPCEDSLLSSLFSNLSLKLSNIEIGSALESEISTLVSFISIYYLNFPFKNHNTTVIHSEISDEEFAENSSVKPIHYALGSSVIFSMLPNTEKAKFVLRNQFGRFCWEACDFMVFEPSTNSEEMDKAITVMKEAKIKLEIQESQLPLNDEPLLPKLMEYIAENYPECYIPEKNIEAGPEILKLIESVEKMEAESFFEEKKVEKNKAKFNMGRYFVANIGLLDELVQLQVDDRFERALGLIDTLPARETVKIGIIYVAPGQQDEREILANTEGSLEFKEFLQNLGDVIDIRDHPGNLGGLDRSGTAGNITISYADWQYDVIFHIVPLMPTDLTDEQQVAKKRHVGNDFVHIVWSDHYRDYRCDTMISHFILIIIVIYPLMPGIFKIQVLKKNITDCGPLQDGMVIPAHLLPSLVRQTAIHANQKARLIKCPSYNKPTQVRKNDIQKLIETSPAQHLEKHQVYASMF